LKYIHWQNAACKLQVQQAWSAVITLYNNIQYRQHRNNVSTCYRVVVTTSHSIHFKLALNIATTLKHEILLR